LHLDKSFGNRAVARTGLILLTTALLASFAATRKNSANGKLAADKNPTRAPVETVFVATPAPAPPPTRSTPTPVPAEVEEKRTRTGSATSLGPTRDFDQSFGLNLGFYNAEILGNNPFADLSWNFFPAEMPFFFEFNAGVGTLQSDFSNSVVGGGLFPHNLLLSTEALGGYTLSGMSHGSGRAGGLFPYFVGGITFIYQGGLPFQGGVPNIGGVIGFGNRTNLPFGPKRGNWAFNYGLHDQIYSQKIRSTPSITQSFIFFIGVQKYY